MNILFKCIVREYKIKSHLYDLFFKNTLYDGKGLKERELKK